MVNLDGLFAFLQGVIATLRSGQIPEFGYWSYVILFLLVAIEGPISVLLAAAAASAGLMRPLPVFFAAAAGNLTADNLWYLLGYMGKTEWIHHIGRWLGVRPSLIEHLKHNMLKHATRVMFLAKITVSFVIPALITAGLLRVPWRRWFPAFIVAEALWTGTLVFIGYYTTESLKRVQQGVEYIGLGVSITLVIVLFLLGRQLLKSLDKEDPAAASD
jgi:membrane protein DedA with SNARE-associated domain